MTLKDDTNSPANNNYDGVKNFYNNLGFVSLFSSDKSDGKMKVYGEIDPNFDQYFLDKFSDEDTERKNVYGKYARI